MGGGFLAGAMAGVDFEKSKSENLATNTFFGKRK